MHLTASSLLVPLLSASALAAPFSFPLSNGFPNPNPQVIAKIEKNAGGTLPNGSPPAVLSAEGVTNLQLIAFNELFEVAFFKELIDNITSNAAGYQLHSSERQTILSALQKVKAQEELHTLNANAALSHFGHQPIEPCQYVFPVTDFNSAIGLASTFTDAVLGTLQDVQQIFAENGDVGLVPAVGSVIGQEGEQNGFYRTLLNKAPSSAPFLTRAARDFAFTAIQSFVVPGSCPNIGEIGLRTFKPLTVLSKGIQAANQTLRFMVDAPLTQSNAIVYLSGQNVPVVVMPTNMKTHGGTTTFSAEFPFDAGFADGLTIAALTTNAGPFADADYVAASTLAGPGLIEVN